MTSTLVAVLTFIASLLAPPAIAQPTQSLEPHEFVIKDFHTERGVVLPEARLVYTTLGKLNAARDNAVLLPSHYMANVNGYNWLIGQRDRALDPAHDFLILTELFGFGWPAPHRVVANEATARWLQRDPSGPGWLRACHRASAPLLSRVPMAMQSYLAGTQRPASPIFGPAAATIDGPANLLEAGPLYAGACIERIGDILPARELVHELSA